MAGSGRLELAGASILRRAVDLDKNGRLTEAFVCYQEGLQILLNYMKEIEDASKKEVLKTKVESYFGRAEQIKKIIEEQKDQGVYHEQITIECDSKGHSYETLIGRFLNSDVKEVRIEDPYIRSHNQCRNYLKFCELLVRKCENLKRIHLVTGQDLRNSNEQSANLKSIGDSLLNVYTILMEVEYSTTLHDRQILLSSGWIIKIGRGLDYFKPPAHKFAIGALDYDLRTCLETKVDIFHSKDVKHSFG